MTHCLWALLEKLEYGLAWVILIVLEKDINTSNEVLLYLIAAEETRYKQTHVQQEGVSLETSLSG